MEEPLASTSVVQNRVFKFDPSENLFHTQQVKRESLDWFKGKFTGNHRFSH